MKLSALTIRTRARMARLARRRLLVRVRPMALAAAVALGATGPMVHAQTIITPLTGAGQTATVVSTQGAQTVVSTQSLRDGNAFSTYSAFQVGQGNTVTMAVPQGANWWVNIVRDSRVTVNGLLESRLTNGSIGGNIMFIDSHGFAVGPTGQVNVGRLSFAAPSTAFVDGLLAGGGVLSGATVNGLLAGEFERSATGAVDIQGRITALDGVSLMGGAGGGVGPAVSITGQVMVQGRAAGSAVNLGDLKSLAPLQDLDGVIDITTPGSIRLDGVLISDSSLWRRAGAVRVVAGNDIGVGANARVSASGAAGSGEAGGQVTLFAQRDIANEQGAELRARGDGAGAGGAIEYSGLRDLTLSSMKFNAGSDAGQAGLVFVDPAHATVEGENLTGGADFEYAGDDTLTVKTGAVINTRDVGTGDATDPGVASVGDSGDIRLAAPHITVEAGSLLDASVVNEYGSNYSAGDITLTAHNTSNGQTLVGLADADASIDVAGLLLGRNITLEASVNSSAVFGGDAGAVQQALVDLTLGKAGLDLPLSLSMAYVEAKGDATVTVRDTAVLDATDDISIIALAEREAGAELQTGGTSSVNLSAGFARVTGTTLVDIQSGAELSAGGDIELVAASKTTIEMNSAAAGETDEESGEANVASVVFAGSQSDVTTAVKVGAGAMLFSGADTHVQAFHAGSYETAAEVTVYGDGAAGVVGALSLHKTDTSVAVDGTVNAGGDVRVLALNATAKDVISASSAIAPEEEPESPLPASLEYTEEDAVEDAKQTLLEGFMAMAEEVAAGSDEASGGESSSPALRMAGVMTWSESAHTTRATVGDGAHITAGGDAVVDAQTLVGQLQSVTEAAAESEAQGVALSVAFNYADHAFTTQARVGANAQIMAGHVAVNAATDIPEFYSAGLDLDWSNAFSAYENLMGGTDPLYDGFNTRVGASAASDASLALAGAVSLSYLKNDTRAWVDTGAQITTTVADAAPWSYSVHDIGVEPDEAIDLTRSFDASTVVRASNLVQTLHLAGGDGSTAGGDGGAVGGTFSMVSRDNTAIAGIADAAVVNTRQLDVAAHTTDWLLTLSPTSGDGEGVAANGMVSYNKLHETTLASISREAYVNAQSVNVNADLSLGVLAVTGAVTKSENSGVGIGVAMNEVTGNTKAYIGDNDTDGGGADTAEGTAGSIQTGQLDVGARSDGLIVAVGVAGAMAGGSSTSGMGDKASSGGGGGGAQSGLDGSGTAALSGVGDSLAAEGAAGEGEGGGEGEEEGEGESKPPAFSIAGAGAIVTNFSDVDTSALIDRAVVLGQDGGTTGVGVRALSDLTQVSVAGGGALAMANNSSTTFSAAIAGAVAIQDSDDDTTARIVDTTVSGLADRASSLTVEALKSGERTAVATGISLNLSQGSTTSVSVAGSASITHVSDDTAASIEGSTLTGAVVTPANLDARVVAYDRSRIGAGGGALSFSTGKGSAGIGATISLVDLQGSTSAKVIGGAITQVHDLTVAALSSQKVVGIGAVAGVQTASDSKGQLMGAFVFNEINNTVSAGITGGAQVNLSGDLDLQAGGAPSDDSLDAMMGEVRTSYVTDYEMESSGNGYTDDFKSAVGGESIVGVAGTLSVTLGDNANSVGLSYVQNNIQTSYRAELEGTVTAAGHVRVDAVSDADIIGISAGLGATKGKFSGMGSASVNLIGQQTQARVSGGNVDAATLGVESGTTGNLFSLAGNLSFAVGSGSGSAAGAAVAYNQTGTRTFSDADDAVSTRAAGNEASVSNTVVNVGSGDVEVRANNTSDTMAAAASGVASDGNLAFGGAFTWNEIGDVTDARISGATVTAANVDVQAGEDTGASSARIRSLAGGLTASNGYSAALAFGFNTIESSRSAQILSSTITASDAVSVRADAQGSIETLSATLAASGTSYAMAGSSSVNWLNGSTTALVDGVTLQGTASSLTVHAAQSGNIDALAGTLSGSAAGAIGGAVAVNLMGDGSDDFGVHAGLTNTTLAAPVSVRVEAALGGDIDSVAVAGSGSGTNAINGSVTRNVIAGEVSALVSHVTQTATGGTLDVLADQTASIASLAGVVNGAGTNAVGGAIAVNDIASTVTAQLDSSNLRTSGAVTVEAGMAGTIESIAAAGSGAGTVAVNGSNTTNSLTSTVKASVTDLTQHLASSAFDVLAKDQSTIRSLAGTVSGGGNAAVGAALALNFLGRTAADEAASKLVLAEVSDSDLQVTGAVNVLARSDSTIQSMGVAAGGGGTFAVTGSNTTNILEDTISANWLGSSLVGANTGSLKIQAQDATSIESLAGNFAGGGTAAVGAASAVNRVATEVSAALSGTGAGHVRTGDVEVGAQNDAEIDTVAVGMSASGTVGVQGSVAVSMLSANTSALIDGGAQVEAWDSVAVTADSSVRIKALAGAGALGAAGVGVAGGVLVNMITSHTTAGIDGADTAVSGLANADGVRANTAALASAPDLMNITAVTDAALSRPVFATDMRRGVAVQATSIEQIAALTTVASGGTVGVGAAVNVDSIEGSTRAYVDGASINALAGGAQAQDVTVLAADHALIASTVATVAGGEATGVAGAVGTETVTRSSHAEVLDGATVQAVNDASVQAVSTATVAQISAGAAGGGTTGVAGSGNVVLLAGDTRAWVDGSSIAARDVSVLAEGANRTNQIAGSIGGGGVTGAGLSFTVNVSGSNVRALVDDSLLQADGDVKIHATNVTEELAVAATVGGGGIAGVAIGAAVTVLEGNTEAALSGNSSVERRTRATGTVAFAGGADVTLQLDSTDGVVTADEQGTARFVLTREISTELEDGTFEVAQEPASLGEGAVVKVFDGTREVTATLNADGSYSADLSTLGDGQLTAIVYTDVSDGAPVVGSPSSRALFTKAAGVDSLSVAALETVDINHNAGGIGAGGVAGVGSAANVVIGRSQVAARASGSAITVGGNLAVTALREAEVDMITATAGGGGNTGISGAVGVLLFGSAPDSNATAELNGGSGSTIGRVSAGTESNKVQGTGSSLSQAEADALNASAGYNTAGAFGGAAGQHSTSADLSADSVQAGAVTVSSLDRTSVENNAGAVAGGTAAGVSAGVAVTILGGANSASVSASQLTSQDGIAIASGTRTPVQGSPAITSRAIAGSGGFVGVGAAVSVASNRTANSATLSGQVNAGGTVSVTSLDQASMLSEAFGASVGVASVGVVVATAEQTGSVATQVGGSINGDGIAITAGREGGVSALAVGGVAGVFAGSGAGATASDSGTVRVTLASGAALDAGQGALAISARSNPHAEADAVGVAVAGGAAVGISVAEAHVDSDVSVTSLGALTLKGDTVNVSSVLGSGDSSVTSQASAGAGALLLGATGASATATNTGLSRVELAQGAVLVTTGDAGITATDSMRIESSAVGIGAGFVGLGMAFSSAVSDTLVAVDAAGIRGVVGGSLQVKASGSESIDSDAVAGSGGVVAGAGAEASVNHDQSVVADLGVTAGSALLVGGMTTVEASRQVRYDSTTTAVNAAAVGASGAVTRATLDGSATARLLDGSTLDSGSLRVLATNDLARTNLTGQSAVGGGGGVFSGAGADVVTQLNGNATASIGSNASILLEDLLELRAYNEVRGSSRAQMDVGGAVPIALVNTRISTNANADATIGQNTDINVYGEAAVNALSYIDIEANSVSKTYGLAAAAQGNAYATANVNNRVTLGTGSELRSTEDLSLLAGQDRNFNRNKHFVTARADLFNHSAIPVSINPDADATLNLNNAVTVNADAVRSGGTIKLGGVEGTLVVEGKGKVSDWTRELGELMGISSDYGSSNKNLSNTAVLNGEFEAGFGNKQRLVIGLNGQILESEGDVRYTITNEDLSASAGAYIDRLYAQLARYGDVPEVRAFVEAELAFYFATLLNEGLAEEMTMEDGSKVIVASSGVAANFLNILDLRAGSGNIELFGDNVTGSASLMARADSEIYIDNQSPLNLRVYDMVVDANGGFAKYNGTYLMSAADIGALNTTAKTTGLSVDSIDTRGGGASQELPKLTIKNTYMPGAAWNPDIAVIASAADGTWADLREDQMRAPEMRVNGWLYNKLGTIDLINTAGSISVYAENPGYTPRLDGKEIQVSAGKNFVLSSPTISQSVGGSPESLYAVHYNDDQEQILDNLGVTACGSARPGTSETTYNANCVVNGAGGVYASGGIFIGARYLNINGTVQSGQADYNVVLSDSTVGSKITAWANEWKNKGGLYLSQGKSSLVQLTGALPTDSEAEVNKQFANGTISASQRTTMLQAMATRRLQPIVYFDAQTNRLQVAATNVQGGLVELVGSIINTGGGVVRALDGYARINIDNQTGYGLDLMGLDTGGDAGVIRITDMSKPVANSNGAFEVTTYQRDADGVFRATVTAGRGVGAAILSTTGSSSASLADGVKARFTYNPAENSTYSWSAGYDYSTEKRYYLKTSSWLGFIPGGTTNWDSVDTYVKTANALAEDVYVSTITPVGGGSFSIQSNRFITDVEKEIYYRSWKKCGFLCIKKTYYVDRRTEVGMKDVFTQRVKADHPINIELVGYDSGVLNVSSVGDIRLGGNITNDSGTVSLTSTQGSISQLNNGAVVEGVDLNFRAKTGIGGEAAPVNLITGAGSFTAVSDTGPISFKGMSGALRINQVSTQGDVWLDGDGSIVGLDPSKVHVIGNRIFLSAPRGGIGEFNVDGSVKSTLNIQTLDAPNGGLTAQARNGIAIKQGTGNLWVNQVVSGGDVYLETAGDLIDNNRNESRDERTEAQLLALWDQAALQGSSAEDSRQLTMTTTRSQFRRYWSLRDVRNVVTDGNGNVTSYDADAIDPSTYVFRFGTEEREQYLNGGLSETQIEAIEAARTTEMKALHAQFGDTDYQTDNDRIITAINVANAANGKSEVGALAEWTDAELYSPLPSAVFSKSSTDTQTRIEEPNVVGNRVVLRSGGQIGNDDGQVVISLKREDRIAQGLAPELTADERLAIMSAESDDMVLDRDNWTLTVVKKDTFNVLSNRLNVESNGFVYLGADTTDTYTNGGTANVELIKAPGEVRIKVTDSILSVANAGVSVIQAQKAVLEAAQGSIGSAAKPLQITLANNATGTLVARANDGIWIHEIGDMRAADIYTPGSATLSATGAIHDARAVTNYPAAGDRAVRSIEANELTLTAQGGAVGESGNPLVVKVGSGGVNATSALGYSVFLQGAAGSGLTVNAVNSGLDFFATATGDLHNVGSVKARGSIFAEIDGDVTGLMYTAGGQIVIGAGGSISGSNATANTGSIRLTAGDDIDLASALSNQDVTVTAGGSMSLTSATAGRALNLTALGGGVQGVSWRAANGIDVAATGNIGATSVLANTGAVTMSSGADLSVDFTTALGNVALNAARNVSLTNATSSNGLLSVSAGQAASLLAGSARGAVTVTAGTGLQASMLTSATSSVDATTAAGNLDIQKVSAAEDVTLTATTGDLSAGAVSTTRGDLALMAAGSMAVASATLPGNITALAGGNADFGKLTSTAGRVELASTGVSLSAGAVIAKTMFGAQALQGAMTVGSFNAATASLQAGTSLTVAGTAATSGTMDLRSNGDALLGNLTSTAGSITAEAAGAVTANALRAQNALAVSAGTGLSAGTLTSVLSSVDVSTDSGSMLINSVVAKTAFNATSGDSLTVKAFNAATASLQAGTGGLTVAGTGATTGAMDLRSEGDAVLATLSSTTGSITAEAAGTVTANTLKAQTALDLSAGTGLTAGSLTSVLSSVDVSTDSGSMLINGAIAKTAFNASSGDSLTVKAFNAATASLQAGTSLTVAGTGATTGAMDLRSEGDALFATLTSTAGSITAEAAGTMTANTLKAHTALDLTAGTGLTAGSLTSTTSSVDVESIAGSVTVNGATAKTSFSARSDDALTIRSFNVTAGNAVLQSGGATLLSTGQTSGDITITSGGHASLGNLTTSSGGKISATSTDGGLAFGTLRAGTGITLDAATSWSGGNAISGSGLYVGNGLVDVLARFGDINIGTLSVTRPVGISKLTTQAGSVRVSQITGLAPNQNQLLVEVAGGTKTVPKGY
ncbi:leukotoxin LktA family filamentous adhesin [Hydrogenophaga sp. BPS33]|uniref:leukotoxin LktA family filamentous adhesin n=1 Tax=Hydrogenophaga sp. BPS33 TaxID=2651974 RepID=UPI00131F5820|nr:leukotoxin LktA family filamentous adhesin [Hydrogenophaga sp. BPS33]QHE87193.1 leukotoxin LktA family filamentous adhesin [Hydrogenophaga sp. BPS33]